MYPIKKLIVHNTTILGVVPRSHGIGNLFHSKWVREHEDLINVMKNYQVGQFMLNLIYE